MKVKDLLTNESKWTKGAYSRNREGEVTDVLDSGHSVCWCLRGAIDLCYFGDERAQVRSKVRMYIDGEIEPWNDSFKTTFQDVKKLIDELDI